MKVQRSSSNRSETHSEAGFTLVENVMSLAIVAVMLTSLYGGFAAGFSTICTTRESQRATQIMLSKLESVRLSNYNQLTNTLYHPTTFTEYFDPNSKATGGAGVVYTGTFTPSEPKVGTIPEAYRTNMMLLTVSVSWTSGKMKHERSMQTYAARDGIVGYISVGN
jgi:prepilin-type N-terminal cleavage/methylation domain-containing protein